MELEAPVERQEERIASSQVRGDVDQVRIDSEVGQAAPVGKEGLARIPIVLVLRDCMLDVLSIERVLEFGGE